MSILITCAMSIFIMLLINYIAKSDWLNSPDKVLIDLDDNIGIKMGFISKVFNMSPLIIPKNKIIKIQKADCISLFYTSGHSVDIWPSNDELESLFIKAKKLLPNAESCIIAS
ncbi:hypothetical protein [Colwellia sp. E2M01]|uniref:hypothetical protein n=1 Tax=Colwellia sp. E2M01 TaxID=2841561 RepID=UPI001C0A292A|nr:hypothetical protein [Colwellia sp. E2M01]MBU2872095.1 hypothetical protein [Colwellia sp. E2M01]